MAPTPGKVTMDLMSFLAIWFENIRKNIFKVEVTNHPRTDNQLESKLTEVVKSINSLAVSNLSVSVINQKEFDVSSLATKLEAVVSAVDRIPTVDNSSLVSAINGLKSSSREVSSVRVVNQKDTKVSFPKRMDVGGSVDIKNFPKKQEVEGSVSLKNIDTIVKGLQVVVESIEDLDLSFKNEFKGFTNVVATPMGSRGALKIWDGTTPATLTTVGTDTGIDVNIIGGSSSNTEYTEGDTGTSLIGVMAMAEGPSNTVTPLQVDAAKLLQVDIAADSAGIGGGTQYAEDAAHGDGDTGTMMLAVRTASPADKSDTDGDYEPLQMDNGRLWTSTTVTGTSDVNISQIASSSANSWGDSSNEGDGGIMALSVRNDALATIVNANLDYAPNSVDSVGRTFITGDASMTALSVTESSPLSTIAMTNSSIDGPAAPTIDSVQQLAINLGAAANQVLVSSAASKQIWVYAVAYTCSVAGTVSFQDEDDTAITGIMDHAANSGLAVGASGNFAMPLWKLATNKDLEVDVVTAAIDGWITYAIVSV